MWGVFGIILSLALLMWLAWRDVSVILLAPLCALVAVLFDPGRPLLATYTQVFMPALGTFIAKYFPLFLLGAVYGKLMEDSGCAGSIAAALGRWLGQGHEILVVVLSCAVLTYGGVSLFVVVFAVYPIAEQLFRQRDIPRRLIPGAIALGAFTFTMTAMPGSVQIQNLIPMQTFNTNAFAAPGLGLIGSALILVPGMYWLNRKLLLAARRCEGFGGTVAMVPALRSGSISGYGGVADSGDSVSSGPDRCCDELYPESICDPAWDTSFLATPAYGSTRLSAVQGTWATLMALLCAIGVVMALQYRTRERLRQLSATLRKGATASLMPVFNTASEVGYGNTIATLAGFASVRQSVTAVAPDYPLVSEAIAVNTLAGVTGSASVDSVSPWKLWELNI